MQRTSALIIPVAIIFILASPTLAGTQSEAQDPSLPAVEALDQAYLERVLARIRPNLTFDQVPPDGTFAEAEIRCNQDGRIISARITNSSGLDAWNRATIRAIERAEFLPRRSDGSALAPVTVIVRSN